MHRRHPAIQLNDRITRWRITLCPLGLGMFNPPGHHVPALLGRNHFPLDSLRPIFILRQHLLRRRDLRAIPPLWILRVLHASGLHAATREQGENHQNRWKTL